MKSRDFCYWLMGVFELTKPETLNNEQVKLIRQHLNLVFKHEIDPSFGDDQGVLEQIHNAEPTLDPKTEEWREGQQPCRSTGYPYGPGPRLTC